MTTENTSSQPAAALAADSAKPVSVVVKADFSRNRSAPPPELPTQEGPLGIRFDFNQGCRVSVPAGEWQVEIRDAGADLLLFPSTLKVADGDRGSAASAKKYFVPFEFVVRQGGAEVFRHKLDLERKKVLIQFPVNTLGDVIGWFPYAAKFERLHGCKLTCAVTAPLIEIFRRVYPTIEFCTPDEINPADYYATYTLSLFFNDARHDHQPSDYRHVGLHRTAAYILGVDPVEAPPRVDFPDDPRSIEEPYVVIATQATSQAKYWNNINGWRETIQFLKDAGYRVICIDQKTINGTGMVWNQIPQGCEDQTGDRPLAERAHWIKHADFFVGLSSGLSWLAWAVGTPVVMISGFTHPTNEFHTPHRVINYHVCNSCWNDPSIAFDNQDFLWCPRKAGQASQFECTRLITTEQVRQAIQQVPAFVEHRRAVEKTMGQGGTQREVSADVPREPEVSAV